MNWEVRSIDNKRILVWDLPIILWILGCLSMLPKEGHYSIINLFYKKRNVITLVRRLNGLKTSEWSPAIDSFMVWTLPPAPHQPPPTHLNTHTPLPHGSPQTTKVYNQNHTTTPPQPTPTPTSQPPPISHIQFTPGCLPIPLFGTSWKRFSPRGFDKKNIACSDSVRAYDAESSDWNLALAEVLSQKLSDMNDSWLLLRKELKNWISLCESSTKCISTLCWNGLIV